MYFPACVSYSILRETQMNKQGLQTCRASASLIWKAPVIVWIWEIGNSTFRNLKHARRKSSTAFLEGAFNSNSSGAKSISLVEPSSPWKGPPLFLAPWAKFRKVVTKSRHDVAKFSTKCRRHIEWLNYAPHWLFHLGWLTGILWGRKGWEKR